MSAEAKWNNIYSDQQCEDISPSQVLKENYHLLPTSGKALDMACGLGANAIMLAKLKLQVEAWDISSNALDKINDYSQANQLNITTKQRDVEQHPPDKNSFDVVVVSQFLHRASFASLCESLTTQGLLFYQTYSVNKVSDSGPNNPDYLLKTNELLSLCEGMEILVYREEGTHGNPQLGWRNQAMIVAKKLE